MKKSYSYAELKGKLKVGMKVSADPERDNGCTKLKDDGSNEGEIKSNSNADGQKYGYCSWCGSPKINGGYYKNGFDRTTGKIIIKQYPTECSSFWCFFKGISNHSEGGGYEP